MGIRIRIRIRRLWREVMKVQVYLLATTLLKSSMGRGRS